MNDDEEIGMSSREMTVPIKDLVPSKRSSHRISVGDASTLSALTMDEELQTISERSMYTTRQSLSYAANKPVITPRTSLEARLSDRSKELELTNLKLQNLPLCGRRNELEALANAFSKVQEGERGLFLVSGISGTGKTSLIEHASFQRKVRSRGGIFITAKCDLREQNEPLASVQDAMSLLSEKILMLQKREDPPQKHYCLADKIPESRTLESRSKSTSSGASVHSYGSGSLSHVSSLEDVQEKLAIELTENEWKVLIQAVPAIEGLMVNSLSVTELQAHVSEEFHTKGDGTNRTVTINTSSQSKMDGSSMKEISDQLKFAYRHFIRVVATICPLVIVFDDCQWQDKASMEWIKSILTDTNKSKEDASVSLLFIASYRSDEVNDDHRLIIMTKELQSMLRKHDDIGPDKPPTRGSNSPGDPLFLQRIHIGNLQVLDLVELLEELLNSNTRDVEELAEVLHKKSKYLGELCRRNEAMLMRVSLFLRSFTLTLFRLG
jgi:hypothetical protein